MMPPDFANKEYDEETIVKDEIKIRSNDDREKAYDDSDDITCFEISVVNKKNQAMSIDAKVYNGEVKFNKIKLYKEGGLNSTQQTWLQKSASNTTYEGPKFDFMSEPL